jgi:hypothetical protein
MLLLLRLSIVSHLVIAAALLTSVSAGAQQWLSYDKDLGKGVYVTETGTRYEGGVLDNKFHGIVVVTWPSGQRYDGNFVAGQYSSGVMTWPNGQRYEGDFAAGQYIKGTLIYTTKDRYEGGFVANKRSGAGVMTFASDGSRFEGEFLDDQPNRGVRITAVGQRSAVDTDFINNKKTGKGIVARLDGLHFEGDFVDGQFVRGIMTWANGQRFEGDFAAGQFSKGVLIHTNKDRYEGSFVAAKKSGPGVLTDASDGSRFEGDFLDDKPTRGTRITAAGQRTEIDMDFVNNKKSGKGVVMYVDGRRYEGDFVNGQHSGKGKLTYASGHVYFGDFTAGKRSGFGATALVGGQRHEGDYLNDQYEGNGVYTWPDGSRYEGQWVANEQEGFGIMTYGNGDRYEGAWRKSEKLGRSRNEQLAAQQQAERQQAEQQAESGGFQWGKAFALAGAAALGGLDQLSGESQVKILGGIALDSMAGQTGIGNVQGATASSIADSQAQLMTARKIREQQAQAMAIEAANNERLLNVARQSRPVNPESQRQVAALAESRQNQQAPATTQQQLTQITQQLERDAAARRTQNQESQRRDVAPTGSGQSPSETTDANISEPRPDFGGRIWMAVGGAGKLAPTRASACQQAIGDREEQIAIEARSARFRGVERRSDCSCSYTARTKSWLCQVWYLPVGHAASGPGNR